MIPAYTGQIKVRFADTDANGHTFLGSYAVLADEVVSEYLEQLGWNLADTETNEFLTFTVNCNIDFLGECLAWDVLEVSCGFTRVGNTSLTIEFEMLNTRNGELATRGSFTYVFVDRKTRKSTAIPDIVTQRLFERQPELAPA